MPTVQCDIKPYRICIKLRIFIDLDLIMCFLTSHVTNFLQSAVELRRTEAENFLCVQTFSVSLWCLLMDSVVMLVAQLTGRW